MISGIAVKRSVFYGVLILVSGSAFYCVSTDKLTQKPCTETAWEPDSIMLAYPGIEREISRLSVMEQQEDTSLSKEEIYTRLFSLYIHADNHMPRYDRAVLLADTLAKIKVQKHERQYYRNCRNILGKYLQLSSARDSLERVIGKISEENKSLRYSARKQVRQRDSLSGMINTQKGALEKLQELDMKLEQQRSKIQ
jgi:hypothetical protein